MSGAANMATRTVIASRANATALTLLLGQICVAGCSLAITMLAAWHIGPEGRGHLALFLQLAYLANVISVAGLDRSYPATLLGTVSAASAMTDLRRLMSRRVVVLAVVCLPVAVVLSGGGTAAFVTSAAFAVTIIGLAASSMVRVAAASASSGSPYLRATLISQGLLLGTGVLLTLTGVRATGYWLLAYGGALLIGPVVIWYANRESTPRLSSDPYAARRMGFELFPAALAHMMMLRLDRLMLPWLGSYAQLGLYVVVATVTELVAWPVYNYVDAQVPAWRRAISTGELRPVRILLAVTGYGFVAAGAVAVTVHVLLVPMLGPSYQASASLVTPLALAAVCQSVNVVAVGINVAAGRTRAVLAAEIPATVVAVACFLLLIPGMGALGAAMGSLVAYATGMAMSVWFCLRAPR